MKQNLFLGSKQNIKTVILAAMCCAAAYGGNSNDAVGTGVDGATYPTDTLTAPVDTFRVAHVRYTPDADYINLESIKNGRPTEQYTEIIGAPDTPTTMFGDTIVIRHQPKHDAIINISAQGREPDNTSNNYMLRTQTQNSR